MRCKYSRTITFCTGVIWSQNILSFSRFSTPWYQNFRKAYYSLVCMTYMNRGITAWVRECIACQQIKITRHTKSPIVLYLQPHARFDHLQVDIVGPLTVSEGIIYFLTIVDRFTRWSEAIPVLDMTGDSLLSCNIRVDCTVWRVIDHNY